MNNKFVLLSLGGVIHWRKRATCDERTIRRQRLGTDAVSFEDAWRQAGDMLQRVPEQLRRYCADKVEPLLRRNMEAGCAGTLFNCARYKFRHDTVTPVLELQILIKWYDYIVSINYW